MDWFTICRYKMLTEEFIHAHENEVDWAGISECQVLTEKFIRNHANKVDWFWISICQTLSAAFVAEFKERIIICDNIKNGLIRDCAIKILIKKLPEDAINRVLLYL